jgi:hypothetical protein
MRADFFRRIIADKPDVVACTQVLCGYDGRDGHVNRVSLCAAFDELPELQVCHGACSVLVYRFDTDSKLDRVGLARNCRKPLP